MELYFFIIVTLELYLVNIILLNHYCKEQAHKMAEYPLHEKTVLGSYRSIDKDCRENLTFLTEKTFKAYLFQTPKLRVAYVCQWFPLTMLKKHCNSPDHGYILKDINN